MRMGGLARACCLVLAGFAAPAHAQTGDCVARAGGMVRAESKQYVVFYRTQPQKLAVSTHFALDIVVCEKAGAPGVEGVSVDALMPAHGHGMNYKASIRPLGAGRYRAEGLMFHMPGQWQFVFDLRTASTTERVAHDIKL